MKSEASKPINNFRCLIVGGNTTGGVDFFTGVNLQSIIGRTMLIRNIEFIPRYVAGSTQQNQIQYLDETGGGNNMDLVSPVDPVATHHNRIITPNVECLGLIFNFSVNGSRVQIIEGADYLLNFDKEFKNVNLYFPEAIQSMSLFATENIITDVTLGTLGAYFLQVNFDIIISPTPAQLAFYGY